MDPLTGVVGTAVVKKIAGEEAKNSANFVKKMVLEKWGNYTSSKALVEYSEKVMQYFYLNTISKPDELVFIDDVYVPIDLSTQGNYTFGTEKLLFKTKNINVISGVAGHGKSTMLRHLMKNVIMSDESDEVPIIFELKYFEEKCLEEQLCQWMINNGLNIKQSFIQKMLRQGKLIVFLDDFDELPSSLMDFCVMEITKLHQKYPKSTITVTTRPGLQITKSQFVVNYKLVDLNKEQVFKIIKNFSGDDARARTAVREIYQSKFISKVIKTPILAILINLTYEHWNHLPETMSEFYEKVFSGYSIFLGYF